MFQFPRYPVVLALTLLALVLGFNHAQDDQPSTAKPITYQDVLKLLENKTEEHEILQRLEKSAG